MSPPRINNFYISVFRSVLHRMAPPALGGENASGDEAARYRNRWLFTPATVLSAVDPEAGVVLIRTRDEEVHRQA